MVVMPILNQDCKKIRREIDDALKPIKSDILSLSPKGSWARALHRAKEFSIFGPTALLAMVIALTITLVNRRDTDVKFQTNTENSLKRLDSLEASVRAIQAVNAPMKVVQELAALDASTLAKNLLALQKVSEKRLSDVNLTTGVLREVGHKLQSIDENTPGYWPTVIQFIRFASTGASSGAAAGAGTFTIANSVTNGMKLKNKVLILDGGSIANFYCENCTVVLTENPVQMRGVVFVNCLFEIPVLEAPSDFIKQASRMLLAGVGSGTTTIDQL